MYIICLCMNVRIEKLQQVRADDQEGAFVASWRADLCSVQQCLSYALRTLPTQTMIGRESPAELAMSAAASSTTWHIAFVILQDAEQPPRCGRLQERRAMAAIQRVWPWQH